MDGHCGWGTSGMMPSWYKVQVGPDLACSVTIVKSESIWGIRCTADNLV